ncbi:hypothetical protein OG985_09225 [Streptomyces sp. NBC_00289]|uniref:hypothetical protein n=1 Tax=Streptomyces sp. NBC_00289 TaxID=2975703 RepID=UPI0032520CD2
MRRTTVRRAPAPALALVGVLGLAGCGRVDTALARLGYGDREVERLAPHGEGVRFTLGLGGVCVEGTLLPGHDSAIEAHGPYLEGGCVEPAYGH